VTTNNDTPQVYSEGPRDDGPFGGDDGPFSGQWADEADRADLAGAGRPNGPPDAEPYGSWFGWEAGSAPADGDGYPQPSFYSGDEGYPPEPEYPRGPGYAPLPPDYRGPGEPGYPGGPGYAHDPGYAPGSGYANDPGYPHDGWNGPGGMVPPDYGYVPDYPKDPRATPDARYLGYAPEPGYERGVDAVPPMESLLDVGRASPEYRTGQASWPGPGPAARPQPGMAGAGGWVPPSRSAPQAPAETSDSLTAESLQAARICVWLAPPRLPGDRRPAPAGRIGRRHAPPRSDQPGQDPGRGRSPPGGRAEPQGRRGQDHDGGRAGCDVRDPAG